MKNLKPGQTYGYYCEHFYGTNSLEHSKEQMEKSRFLKGIDYDIYIAAESLKAKKNSIKSFFLIIFTP
jgi:hypothetical protein